MGTFQTTKAVYDKVLDLRVATPQLVLNFAAWLEENKHFEEAFKAYEKGVALFNFPYVHDIFFTYFIYSFYFSTVLLYWFDIG